MLSVLRRMRDWMSPTSIPLLSAASHLTGEEAISRLAPDGDLAVIARGAWIAFVEHQAVEDQI